MLVSPPSALWCPKIFLDFWGQLLGEINPWQLQSEGKFLVKCDFPFKTIASHCDYHQYLDSCSFFSVVFFLKKSPICLSNEPTDQRVDYLLSAQTFQFLVLKELMEAINMLLPIGNAQRLFWCFNPVLVFLLFPRSLLSCRNQLRDSSENQDLTWSPLVFTQTTLTSCSSQAASVKVGFLHKGALSTHAKGLLR